MPAEPDHRNDVTAPLGPIDNDRKAALEVYESADLPEWKRSGFWKTSLKELDLEALAPKYHAENEKVRKEYMKLLTPSELAAVKKHRAKWESDKARKLAWEALKSKDVPEARRQAMATFRKATTALESWRVMYCALRGR